MRKKPLKSIIPTANNPTSRDLPQPLLLSVTHFYLLNPCLLTLTLLLDFPLSLWEPMPKTKITARFYHLNNCMYLLNF